MTDWHHAPLHRFGAAGAYSVTAGTYLKKHFFREAQRLDLLVNRFFECMGKFGWEPQAWSFFSNHYHFVALSSDDARALSKMLNEFHSSTARMLNEIDEIKGRQVWYQFWDTHLTHPGSYLARFRYVQENAVHHRLVENAEDYRWCSAGSFARNASSAFQNALHSIKTDRVTMIDSFEPIWSAVPTAPL
jgi:REP element-mobilizing transposase RayT